MHRFKTILTYISYYTPLALNVFEKGKMPDACTTHVNSSRNRNFTPRIVAGINQVFVKFANAINFK